MKVTKLEIEPLSHNIFKIEYTRNDLNDIIIQARKIEGNLNPYDPYGNIRDDETISIKNLAGLISEKVVSDLLLGLKKQKDDSIEILGSNWEEIQNALYQIDHRIRKGNKLITIETRSSFSYRTDCPKNVVNYAFSIIGPYTTANKSKEHYKDYYAFAFYCLNPNELKNKIQNDELVVYFAGGATISMLEQSNSNLTQNGTNYLVVKPITKGLDANNFFKTILEN
ncbi:hypothetical protein L5F39_00310 [Aliarcobacter butzleri]|uniref:hypothetical protein n=1 Tax=Aliarcobacter butzleri TaxID=28197 RepID=UPI001EE08C11|nr:hypothetical protein [Aliarcobacter butzleri]MCG3696037.1 hypothetical protein [Aliarcobacter butzleri]